MRNVFFRGLVWTLVLLVPAVPVMADMNAAMLYAKGKVTVNGGAVLNAQAVFPGDQVRTGKDSAVTIAVKGSNVVVMANSGVVLGSNTIAVSEGSATIVTSQGMTASVRGISVSPASGQKARFEVAQVGGKVRISALEGRLSISDGKQTTMLDAGKQLTTGNSGLGNAPAGANSLAGAAIALIVIGIAAVSTGIIIATTGEVSDTSPSTFNP
ncbi:MAG: hypothetical protein ACRD2Y_10885 [Terriglobales bacterium]